jgi:hypothetical protein
VIQDSTVPEPLANLSSSYSRQLKAVKAVRKAADGERNPRAQAHFLNQRLTDGCRQGVGARNYDKIAVARVGIEIARYCT